MWRSLISESVASMALQTPGIIDVIATRTAPIIRTWNITFATTSRLILIRMMFRFGIVTSFAFISKFKVQKIALQTIPLSILFVLSFMRISYSTSLTRKFSSILSGLRS